MENFDSLRNTCELHTRNSNIAIDEFLLYYAAQRNRLDKSFDRYISAYKHITREFDKSWVNMLKSQFIVHRIFCEDGLIRKFLSTADIKAHSHHDWLAGQAITPWRFSFAQIADSPSRDFYRMVDMLSGERYLIFSPGMSLTLSQYGEVTSWLNLIGSNGECWQSFGPIAAYKAFDVDDIFFFVTERNPNILDEDDLQADLEENPVPYMMLLAGANFPISVSRDHQLKFVSSSYERDPFDTGLLRKDFKIEYSDPVYRFTSKEWGETPHFSKAYYDEKEEVLEMHAMTDHGFAKLADMLQKAEVGVYAEPHIRVSPAMHTTCEKILNKKITLDPYSKMFEETASPASQALTGKLNELMQLALPEINAGRKPDIAAMAKKVGLDEETARDIMSKVMESMGKLKDKRH